MLKRIEDITVISGEEFHSFEGEMIYVDTECPFRTQPIAQAYIGFSDTETKLPDHWQEIGVFGNDIFLTYEGDTLHTFILLDFKEQFEPNQFLFIKVIALGEPNDTRTIRIS